VTAAGLAVALGAGIVVRAEAARAGWSQTREVLVARTDIPPGTRLGPEHLSAVELPGVAIPPGALSPAQAPAPGAISGGLITAGEVVLPHRLAPAGTSAAAARVGAGRRAVAIPVAVDPGVISAGDSVDLVVVADPLASAGTGIPLPPEASRGAPRTPGVVAGDAEVLDVAPGVVTVVVAAGDAPRVVAAMATGTLIPVLVGR
jgi:Flp pilus assembly protein CpaB